jgi:hypothetical protein
MVTILCYNHILKLYMEIFISNREGSLEADMSLSVALEKPGPPRRYQLFPHFNAVAG